MSERTKRCTHCELYKSLDAFGVDRSRKDGLKVYCKICIYTRSQSKKSQAARQRWIRSGGLERQREHAKTAQAKAVRNARLKANRTLRKQTQLTTQVFAAIQAGELAHPSARPCLGCHDRAEEYHHHNYRRPFDVTPLCRDCHVSLHAYMRHNGLSVQR